GQLAFHPGPQGQFALVRWTAQRSGTVTIDASFLGMDIGGTDVHVLKNGKQVDSGDVNGRGQQVHSLESLVVSAGDTIDFAVGGGRNGNSCGDTTGLDAKVTLFEPAPDGEAPVTLAVTDGRGGTATQDYTIDVQPEPGNPPPVIVSEPVTSVSVS